MQKRVCFTFDIEEWFQVENLRSAYPVENWDDPEQRAEHATRRILDLLDRYTVKGTFFILGWVAARRPELVREIVSRGHEVASHGFYHRRCDEMDMAHLMDDIGRARDLLEEIGGRKVIGYRAPSFSINPELMEALARLGFKYDSSLNPVAFHDRYGSLNGEIAPEGPFRHASGVYEFPLPVLSLGGLPVPISGGGYFRLIPFFVYRGLVKRYLLGHDLFVFYLHPWEIDPGQPRVRHVSRQYRFRHYTGLSKSFKRLETLLERYAPLAVTLESLLPPETAG